MDGGAGIELLPKLGLRILDSGVDERDFISDVDMCVFVSDVDARGLASGVLFMLAIDVVFRTLFCDAARRTLLLAVLPCRRMLPILGILGRSLFRL